MFLKPCPGRCPCCLPPSRLLQSHPLPPIQLSAALWSDHRAGDYSRLSCPQDHRPNSGRLNTESRPRASESAEHMPFRKNPEGLATITHLANATGKGFILWATLDRIISLYSALQQAPPHCERTATAGPLNLLKHCTK